MISCLRNERYHKTIHYSPTKTRLHTEKYEFECNNGDSIKFSLSSAFTCKIKTNGAFFYDPFIIVWIATRALPLTCNTHIFFFLAPKAFFSFEITIFPVTRVDPFRDKDRKISHSENRVVDRENWGVGVEKRSWKFFIWVSDAWFLYVSF